MTEESGVEIRSPHEEVLEERAREGGLAQRIALTTAILATVGAFFGYRAGVTLSEAMLLKNDQIVKQAQASDQWAFYQAKATRAFISRSMAQTATDPVVRERFTADAERYDKEKEEVRKEAEGLVAESRKLEAESRANIVPHERISLGVTLLQVAVALASITLLTRKEWLYFGALAFALAGVGVALYGFASS
jgi:Domain of unknown function (DUF4337)